LIRTGNYIEAAVWMLMAVIGGVYAFNAAGTSRRRWRLVATTLLLFALSDVVEAQTGAWWRPWWLLAWKALCLVVFAWVIIQHFRDRVRSRDWLR